VPAPIMKRLHCAHCDAPLEYRAGEVLVTCGYCGYTQVVDVGQPFLFEHFMLPNQLDQQAAEAALRDWMSEGFLKPPDLRRKARITRAHLRFLPFWLLEVTAATQYRGIFERINPPVVKSGTLRRTYHWLLLARRRAGFPTKEYDLPAAATQPYDFRQIPEYAEVINAQLTRQEAEERAKQEVEEHHRYLISQDVDRIIEMKTDFTIGEVQYVHAPVWYFQYKYKRELYNVLLCGHRGIVIAGEFPEA